MSQSSPSKSSGEIAAVDAPRAEISRLNSEASPGQSETTRIRVRSSSGMVSGGAASGGSSQVTEK
ncbi:hypothetical protein CKA38_05195 [Ereboglobus luteus]|uniref:Uncharacterized protein n=1 Tax=Ereboglobus luteus TaxID=1796921 RepID=A0A2U8E1P4_9BACT|nr:hypothetical protein CKA38_05195 [Ereboglobus luteus]